jgi:hypothetical protein
MELLIFWGRVWIWTRRGAVAVGIWHFACNEGPGYVPAVPWCLQSSPLGSPRSNGIGPSILMPLGSLFSKCKCRLGKFRLE